MQHHSSAIHAILLLAAAALALPFAAAQPWRYYCGTDQSQSFDQSQQGPKQSNTYQGDLLDLSATLRRNLSSSPTLFVKGTTGAVYGLVLCRGDLSAAACAANCTIDEDVKQICNTSMEAVLVYNVCSARFSEKDFLDSTNNSDVVAHFDNGSNITSKDVEGYSRAITELLNATVRYAVENSTSLFATGLRVGTDPGFRNIYSMAQCSPDLKPALCQRCLDDLVTQWFKTYFPLNGQGARAVGARCNMRSETAAFYNGSPMVRLQDVPPSPGGKNNSGSKILVIILPIVAVAIVAAISFCMWGMRKKSRSRRAVHFSRPDAPDDFESVESSLLSLESLRMATENFDERNKLGEGGFGAVYKGFLSGQEVAVKRLSKGSNQGLEELKNELVLVAKLHHKNLVRLVGFCLEEGEKLLVYEYMPNKSLDTLLFNEEQRRRLDWERRFRIIEGVARGLQYLHQDSQKKIIHRDMKPSNILLDSNMNPKIGDFGLAKLFEPDQTRDVTKHVAGTFGYMAPEYVMRGQYSTKSDVFSFGILVIEIVTGQRNTGSYFSEQNEDIISIVWRHWEEGHIAEVIDHFLGRNYPEVEVLKCINIGLLCIQHNPVDRPTMADVMVLLNSDATSTLSAPIARPTFFIDGTSGYSHHTGRSSSYSQTITQLSAR